MARSTTNLPCQIIQVTRSEIPEEIRSYLSTNEAQRKKVKRACATQYPTEPDSINDLNIPGYLMNTKSNQPFLMKESSIGIIDINNHNNFNLEFISGDDKILVFCTTSKIRKLSQGTFWIIDGTFKTVPTLFKQLYTIRAQVGFGDYSQILPLVYVLMTSKREQCYKQMYQVFSFNNFIGVQFLTLIFLRDLIDFTEDNGVNLAPDFIISDFELAAINASKSEFPLAKNKGCFFHLSQSACRKLQGLGLSVEYGVNESFSIKVHQMVAIAFLPENEIADAFKEVKEIMPENAKEFVQWFENNYTLGKLRRVVRNKEVRNDPLFPPSLRSVYENIGI